MNQNTPEPTATRSKPARHTGRAGNDTNRLTDFEAMLALLKRTRIGIIIKANSLNEARQQAKRLAEIVMQLNFDCDEVLLEAIKPVEGGCRHD